MRTPALLLLGTVAGCSAAGGYTDFDLLDVNPASPSSGEEVGPADHREQISAWYFGHSN